MHPHLSQDPLTGQTILLGPMSTLVHTDQICKYVGYFSTIHCLKLNYLRKRGIGGKESISTQKLQDLGMLSSPGSTVGDCDIQQVTYSPGMSLLPKMEI